MRSAPRIGSTLQGRGARVLPGAWAEIVSDFGPLLPPFPGIETVPPATVPFPPTLKATKPLEERGVELARAYATVAQHLYGFRPLRNVTLETIHDSKHWPALAFAAHELTKLIIPPIAWCAFSFHVWQNHAGNAQGRTWDAAPSQVRRPNTRRNMPAVRWVFAKKRLAERTEWFSWYESMCAGGRLVFFDEHDVLHRKYVRMQRMLIREHGREPLTEERVKDIVSKTLPIPMFERLKDAAEAQVDIAEKAMRDRVKRGEYIW